MIIVMGLPGAGKSTVISVAQEQGWEILNYGTLMFEIASEKFGVKTRDDLRKLDNETQKKIQATVGERLKNLKKREIILDTHCSVNTPTGYLPGLPYSLLRDITVEKLVLITAPIDEVIGRRRKDSMRVRDEQSAESLKEHDDINKAFLATYSVISEAPAVIIINADGKIEQARERFKRLM